MASGECTVVELEEGKGAASIGSALCEAIIEDAFVLAADD